MHLVDRLTAGTCGRGIQAAIPGTISRSHMGPTPRTISRKYRSAWHYAEADSLHGSRGVRGSVGITFNQLTNPVVCVQPHVLSIPTFGFIWECRDCPFHVCRDCEEKRCKETKKAA